MFLAEFLQLEVDAAFHLRRHGGGRRNVGAGRRGALGGELLVVAGFRLILVYDV